MKRYTHHELREWGEALDRVRPKNLGETLLCYADDWRKEVDDLRALLALQKASYEREIEIEREIAAGQRSIVTGQRKKASVIK